MTRTRSLVLLVGALAFAPVVAPARPAAAAEPVDLMAAVENSRALGRLLLDLGSSDAELIAAIRLVAREFHDIQPPTEPAALRSYFDRAKTYRRWAREHFMSALVLVRIDPKTKSNRRDLVCVEAARALGDVFGDPRALPMVRQAVAWNLIQLLETRLYKPQGYHVSMDLTQACLDTLAHLNEMRSLEWMRERFTNLRDVPEDVLQMVAAHKAMVKFTHVPGGLRYDIVKSLVQVYGPAESRTGKISASGPRKTVVAPRFWADVRDGVLLALDWFARSPVTEEGKPPSNMEDWYSWWGRHNNRTREPWLDRPV